MSVKIIGTTSGVELDIDSDKHVPVVTRPPAFGALGAYSKGLTTGQIAATGAANAVIWAMRWTDATRFALIERVRINAVVGATITAAVPYNLQLFFSRGFTVSPTTSIGTTGTFTGSNGKRRTSMGTSLMGGMWILGTVAAGLTGQTLGNDTDPLGVIVGASGTAIGSQFFGVGMPCDLWGAEAAINHPLILAQNEGLAIQAPLAGPATGTFAITVDVDWTEVAAY